MMTEEAKIEDQMIEEMIVDKMIEEMIVDKMIEEQVKIATSLKEMTGIIQLKNQTINLK